MVLFMVLSVPYRQVNASISLPALDSSAHISAGAYTFLSPDMHACGCQVWDMASGQCTQSLDKAHGSVITDMIFWEVQTLPPHLIVDAGVFAQAVTLTSSDTVCLPVHHYMYMTSVPCGASVHDSRVIAGQRV